MRAYLELMQMRMPDRLQFALHIDPAAKSLQCPPMTLLTLVENAVRHGIDPSEEGGRIDVDVWLRDGRCHVRVTDTGVGLQSTEQRTGHRAFDAARATAARVRRRCAVASHRSRAAWRVCGAGFPGASGACMKSQRPTALIADDEPLLRDALERMLAQVVAGAEDRRAGAQRSRGHRSVRGACDPDVCFLDVHMPGMTGVEAARHIGRRAHLVFVTAYDQYAVQAFAQGVLDYLVKPVEPSRLAETVARLKERLRAAQPALEYRSAAAAARREPADELRRRRRCAGLRASVGQTVRLIPVDDIDFLRSEEKYTHDRVARRCRPAARSRDPHAAQGAGRAARCRHSSRRCIARSSSTCARSAMSRAARTKPPTFI